MLFAFTRGDNLSNSILAVNDVELSLQKDPNAGLNLDQLSLYLFLLADDAVLFSGSAERLQYTLNNFETHCDKCRLKVNVEKMCGFSEKGDNWAALAPFSEREMHFN